MGGLRSGDVASGLIVTAFSELQSANGTSVSDGKVREAVGRVNDELIRRAAAQSDRGTMGTTVTAFFVDGDKFRCLWAGDSRLYRLRKGAITQLTRDHRYIQELLDVGVITEMEAKQHPKRHVITRAIGVDSTVRLDAVDGTIEPGDIYILTTDGVTGISDDDDLTEMVTSASSLESACDTIVAHCLENGAPDNLTMILISVS